MLNGQLKPAYNVQIALEAVIADSGYCSGCGHKPGCLYQYNGEINDGRNQTEGHFGDIKENEEKCA